MSYLFIPPTGWLTYCGDWLMAPLMYLVAGSFTEAPQETHRWNNLKFNWREVKLLELDLMTRVTGTPAGRRWLGKIPLFHLPILGGWREYVVLAPAVPVMYWHPGWYTSDVCGASRLARVGSVRLLRGNETAYFFGVNECGEQIPLTIVGYGRIGDGGPFAHLPLL